ncbi:MAG: hypothetical protein CYG60_04080 [Actinobacteria bacterium]|nr:hypothetical protein [Actinomycetota bacterium]PLS87024.1 MAG: hypothetical protein CYG60_04080 [Actinomycetota bacterium]
MAMQGRELLSKHYDGDRLTYGEVRDLGMRVVTEDGTSAPRPEFRGEAFRRSANRDAGGYAARRIEETGQDAAPAYRQLA